MASYTIQKGDTLSALAKRYQTTVADLFRLNPAITNPNTIYAGRQLALPGSPQATPPSAAAIPTPAVTPPAQTPLPVIAQRNHQQLMQAAQAQLSGRYQLEQQQAQQSAAQQQQALEQLLQQLLPAYQQQLSQLGQQYQRERQDLSDAALSRGMGRSSYLLDQLGASGARETQHQQALDTQRAQREAQLGAQLMQVQTHLRDTLARLGLQQQDALADAINTLRRQDQQGAQDALRYNNDLSLKQADLALRQQQDEWKRTLEQEKLSLSQQKAAATPAKATGSKRSGASTSGTITTANGTATIPTGYTLGTDGVALDKNGKAYLDGEPVYTQAQLAQYNTLLAKLESMPFAIKADYLDANRSKLQKSLGPLWYRLLEGMTV